MDKCRDGKQIMLVYGVCCMDGKKMVLDRRVS